MPVIEFVGQSAGDADNEAANTSRLVNCYREPVDAGGRTRYALKSVLGQVDYATVPVVLMQDMHEVDGVVYAVAGGGLYRVSGPGAVSSIGSVVYSEETSIAANTGTVTVCAGGRYFTFDGTAITEPTAGAFSDFGSVDFIGGYTVLTERGGRKFQWSDLNDASDLPGLNFASAEGTNAPILRAYAINGFLWLFKARSVERWYVTGLAGAEAFERVGGAQRETGLRAFSLICRLPNGAFFVGSDGRVHITSGDDMQPVSNPAVESAIKYRTPKRCFFYEDEGHGMCVITFADAAAWVLDLATMEWHERAEGGSLNPWSAVASANVGGEWLLGSNSGRIGRLARVNRDFEGPLVRRMVSRAFWPGRAFSLSSLEFFGRVGIEAERQEILLDVDGGQHLVDTGFETVLQVGGYDVDPALMVRLSRDGGHVFGPVKQLNMGRPGEYMRRMLLRAQGQFRRPGVVMVDISAPVEVPIYADGWVEVA